MTIVLVLAMPNFSKPFVIKTNGLGIGLRVVMMQEGRLISYMSQVLSPGA